VISSGGNLFIGLLVATFLSPQGQGYFYVLLSLCAAYTIIDLGMTTAVLQFVSHELAFDDRGINIKNIRNIVNKTFRWFCYGAIIFIIISIIFGDIYFKDQNDSYLVWPGIWVGMVLVISVEILLLTFMGVIEGCNRVKSIYRYRALKSLIFTLSVSIMLAANVGLLSLFFGYILTWPLSWYFVCKENKDIFSLYDLKILSKKNDIELSEFSAFQVRLAVSTLAGFLATWAIVPLAVKVLGPVIGGKIGLVWSFGFGVTTLASIPMNVSQATIARLAARGDRKKLEEYIVKVGGLSIFLCFLGCSFVLIFIYMANFFEWAIEKRLLSPHESSILLLGTFLMHLTLPISNYLRAHKIEPLMYVSIFFSCAMLLCTYSLTEIYGEIGFLMGYPIVAGLVAIPWIFIIFTSFRKQRYGINEL